jgi:hypothetical protein
VNPTQLRIYFEVLNVLIESDLPLKLVIENLGKYFSKTVKRVIKNL